MNITEFIGWFFLGSITILFIFHLCGFKGPQPPQMTEEQFCKKWKIYHPSVNHYKDQVRISVEYPWQNFSLNTSIDHTLERTIFELDQKLCKQVFHYGYTPPKDVIE